MPAKKKKLEPIVDLVTTSDNTTPLIGDSEPLDM